MNILRLLVIGAIIVASFYVIGTFPPLAVSVTALGMAFLFIVGGGD